jgi:hypothetical protein
MCLPTAYPVKAALPFGSSNNGLHSCRLSIAEKCLANNQQEQSKAPLTVRYKIHASAQPIQQQQHNLHAYSSVTWSQEIMQNLHVHSSVTWSHDIMDDWHP